MGNEVKTKMKLYTRAKMTSKPHHIWWFLQWSKAESELEDAAAPVTGVPRRLGFSVPLADAPPSRKEELCGPHQPLPRVLEVTGLRTWPLPLSMAPKFPDTAPLWNISFKI